MDHSRYYPPVASISPGDADPLQETVIQPVARVRAHEEVARQLQELIHHGILHAGQRLPPERELARRFQVSRATVRHALSTLHNSGLVDSRPGAGTFVQADTTPSGTDMAAVLRTARASLADQLGLRRLVEPHVALLAAEHAHQTDLAELERSVERQQECATAGIPFIAEDSAFHLAIARATGNVLMATMVEGIHELLRDSRERSLRAPGGLHRSLQGHRAILDALRRRDGPAARAAMLNHIEDVERLVHGATDR